MISSNKSICTLQITDTTGSHQFPAMQRLSISKGHAFILVFSISSRQSLEELKAILELVNEVSSQHDNQIKWPHCPMLKYDFIHNNDIFFRLCWHFFWASTASARWPTFFEGLEAWASETKSSLCYLPSLWPFNNNDVIKKVVATKTFWPIKK